MIEAERRRVIAHELRAVARGLRDLAVRIEQGADPGEVAAGVIGKSERLDETLRDLREFTADRAREETA